MTAGGGSVFYLPQVKYFIISNLHTEGEVGEVETGLINPDTKTVSELPSSS